MTFLARLLNKKQVVVTLKLYADRMELVSSTQISGIQMVTEFPEKPYSSVRLLVHDIELATDCLKRAIDKCNLEKNSRIKLIIQPCEKIQHGLCDTEVRVLQWLGKQAKCAVTEIDAPMARLS